MMLWTFIIYGNPGVICHMFCFTYAAYSLRCIVHDDWITARKKARSRSHSGLGPNRLKEARLTASEVYFEDLYNRQVVE